MFDFLIVYFENTPASKDIPAKNLQIFIKK